MDIENNLALLGLKVEDRVTGLKGVVTSVCFDLYGCIQALVHPGLDETGKTKNQNWLDVARLRVLDQTPVMDRPRFALSTLTQSPKGAAEKPAFIKI